MTMTMMMTTAIMTLLKFLISTDGRKIVSICPRQEVYNVGDKLKCTAIADHLPLSYMWEDLISGETTIGDELIITSNMTGEWKKIQCLVKYRPPNISNSWNAEDEIQFQVPGKNNLYAK